MRISEKKHKKDTFRNQLIIVVKRVDPDQEQHARLRESIRSLAVLEYNHSNFHLLLPKIKSKKIIKVRVVFS